MNDDDDYSDGIGAAFFGVMALVVLVAVLIALGMVMR